MVPLSEKIDEVNGHDASVLTEHITHLEERSDSMLHTAEEIKADSGANGSATLNSLHPPWSDVPPNNMSHNSSREECSVHAPLDECGEDRRNSDHGHEVISQTKIFNEDVVH